MRIDVRLFAWLVLGFVLSTVIGTLGHEAGHWLAARLAGHPARINYAATFLLDDADEAAVPALILAGPLQTALVGTFGVVLLRATSRWRWLAVFLALHWLRQPANFASWLVARLLGQPADQGDEVRLARMWGLPDMSVIAPTAAIGTAVLAWVTFRVVPAHQRLTFLAAGLFGGCAGAVLWFGVFGPRLLP